MVVGWFLDQLLSQLVLLLLLVECLDNTLLLFLDGLLPSSASAVVNHLSARIVLIVLVAWITGTVILMNLRIQSHSLPLQPVLVSLLAKCLNDALLLLLDRRLCLDHLLMLDDYVHRMVRIARRIVLDDLLRVVVVRAVVQSRHRHRRRRRRRVHRFDHLQRRRRTLLGMRRLLLLMVVVHLELVLRG